MLGWNECRIEVNNNVIKVALNGTDKAQYSIPGPATVHFPAPWDQRRGRYPASERTFIGRPIGITATRPLSGTYERLFFDFCAREARLRRVSWRRQQIAVCPEILD